MNKYTGAFAEGLVGHNKMLQHERQEWKKKFPRIVSRTDAVNRFSVDAFVGDERVGTARISPKYGGQFAGDEWELDYLDVNLGQDKKGYDTAMLKTVAKQLSAVRAKTLIARGDESTKIATIEQVFGTKNVRHKSGGENVLLDKAMRIADTGYWVQSKVNVAAYRKGKRGGMYRKTAKGGKVYKKK